MNHPQGIFAALDARASNRHQRVIPLVSRVDKADREDVCLFERQLAGVGRSNSCSQCRAVAQGFQGMHALKQQQS